jgi:hypothetical protein
MYFCVWAGDGFIWWFRREGVWLIWIYVIVFCVFMRPGCRGRVRDGWDRVVPV